MGMSCQVNPELIHLLCTDVFGFWYVEYIAYNYIIKYCFPHILMITSMEHVNLHNIDYLITFYMQSWHIYAAVYLEHPN